MNYDVLKIYFKVNVNITSAVPVTFKWNIAKFGLFLL